VVAAAALALVLALSWAVGALGGGSLAASGDAAPATVSLQMQPVAQATYVVAPGDTLWSIARHLVPEGDVRPVVDALAADRDGRPLQVGERLVVELP
jgi:LysM repeat protein